jgi:hypothetical protein
MPGGVVVVVVAGRGPEEEEDLGSWASGGGGRPSCCRCRAREGEVKGTRKTGVNPRATGPIWVPCRKRPMGLGSRSGSYNRKEAKLGWHLIKKKVVGVSTEGTYERQEKKS